MQQVFWPCADRFFCVTLPKNLSTHMQNRFFLFACLLALTMSACQPQMRIEDPTLQEACRELWTDVRKADSLYEAIDPLSLSSYEQHRRALLKAHLDLKLRQTIDGSTDLKQIASWFASHDDDASAAEAFYIAGAYANWQDDNARRGHRRSVATRSAGDGVRPKQHGASDGHHRRYDLLQDGQNKRGGTAL